MRQPVRSHIDYSVKEKMENNITNDEWRQKQQDKYLKIGNYIE